MQAKVALLITRDEETGQITSERGIDTELVQVRIYLPYVCFIK